MFGMVITSTLEIAAFCLIVLGFIKEERLVAFEDKIKAFLIDGIKMIRNKKHRETVKRNFAG